MMRFLKPALMFAAGAALILSAQSARAAITGQLLGTAAPGSVIDGVLMTAFGPDPQPVDLVTGVASPLGGSVAFSDSLLHTTVGESWATWSHDYTGDVYRKFDSQPLTLTLPANTQAFYLYIEPNDGTQPFSLTATGSDGGVHALNDDIFWQASAKGFFFKAVGETIASTWAPCGRPRTCPCQGW